MLLKSRTFRLALLELTQLPSKYRHSRTANREWTRGAEKCPLLILDEATSALASEVEAAIQDQLIGLMEGKTVIAIARQLSNPGRHAERRRLDVPPLTVPAYGIRG